MKTSLFLVNSPLEMISAIEAREHFDISNTLLLLYISETDKKAVSFLLEKSKNWNNIKWISRKSYYGLSWILLIKKLKKKNYQYFFSPGGSLTGHFLFNLSYDAHFFLDDGVQTLNLSRYYAETLDFSKKMSLFEGKNKYGFKYTLIEKLHNLFNHNFRGEYKEPNFFTFFELKHIEGQTVVKNNFKWFQTLTKTDEDFFKQKNVIYIIGSALVTDKILSLPYYLEVLKKIEEKYRSEEKELVYIFHRRETQKQLDEIKQHTNLIIKENEYLIEIDFFANNKIPIHIVGTISTALYTLKKLYGEELTIDSFLFNEKEVAENRRKDVKEVYNHQNSIIDNLYTLN